MKSKTPICDFVKKYSEQKYARFHMPGHKGKDILGFERYDITEINGADSLYEAKGIIAESERNAAELFGSRKTLYSVEGSSQCIRAMIYLAVCKSAGNGRKPVIVATRNAHKVFAQITTLLDVDVVWLESEQPTDTLCSCYVSARRLEEVISSLPYRPCAVYVTSPDYLGNIADIRGFAAVAHKCGSLLIADNAHGAYLKWVDSYLHPLDNGADMCCDSAHKTLPVLTGGAYLHIGKNAPAYLADEAKNAMSMFGSTSPSYLTLQSLDNLNGMLFDGYGDKIRGAVSRLNYFKKKFTEKGWTFLKTDEPLKVTVDARANGYVGTKLAKMLIDGKVMPEYYDPDYVTLMVSGETSYDDFEILQNALNAVPLKKPLARKSFTLTRIADMTMKEALTRPSETVNVNEAIGRVLACPTVSCPPAIPMLSGGERITEEAAEILTYYGIKEIKVIK
ncbi:MAG: amino acid decarboxylase [Firmicutes bacterium]|nr:amino acid decarboxylase [Bacillota bacterium]